MPNISKNKEQIKVVGKSWVIDLPKAFTDENDLPNGTQVLLTFKEPEKVEAEILPPVSAELGDKANRVLKKRSNVFKELKRIGD